MTDRASWNMARIASNRPLPRERKLHPTTVGKPMSSQAGIGAWNRKWVNEDEVACCSSCGYHVCDCSRRAALAREQLSAELRAKRKKPAPDAAAKAFLKQALESRGIALDKSAVQDAIDKTLRQEAHERARVSRQELEREFAKLTPSERGSLNVRCAEMLVKQNVKHARMLDNAGVFFKGESVEILGIQSAKSGLVTIIDTSSALRRSVVPAAKLTW